MKNRFLIKLTVVCMLLAMVVGTAATGVAAQASVAGGVLAKGTVNVASSGRAELASTEMTAPEITAPITDIANAPQAVVTSTGTVISATRDTLTDSIQQTAVKGDTVKLTAAFTWARVAGAIVIDKDMIIDGGNFQITRPATVVAGAADQDFFMFRVTNGANVIFKNMKVSSACAQFLWSEAGTKVTLENCTIGAIGACYNDEYNADLTVEGKNHYLRGYGGDYRLICTWGDLYVDTSVITYTGDTASAGGRSLNIDARAFLTLNQTTVSNENAIGTGNHRTVHVFDSEGESKAGCLMVDSKISLEASDSIAKDSCTIDLRCGRTAVLSNTTVTNSSGAYLAHAVKYASRTNEASLTVTGTSELINLSTNADSCSLYLLGDYMRNVFIKGSTKLISNVAEKEAFALECVGTGGINLNISENPTFTSNYTVVFHGSPASLDVNISGGTFNAKGSTSAFFVNLDLVDKDDESKRSTFANITMTAGTVNGDDAISSDANAFNFKKGTQGKVTLGTAESAPVIRGRRMFYCENNATVSMDIKNADVKCNQQVVYTIDYSGSAAVERPIVDITIHDGSFTSTGGSYPTFSATSGSFALTVKGGKVTNEGYCRGSSIAYGAIFTDADVDASIVIEGGTVTTEDEATDRSNHTIHVMNGNVTVSGGTVNNNTSYAPVSPKDFTTTEPSHTIWVEKGDVTVTGGLITTQNFWKSATEANGYMAAAVIRADRGTVTVSGSGKVLSTGEAFAIYAMPAADDDKEIDVTINVLGDNARVISEIYWAIYAAQGEVKLNIEGDTAKEVATTENATVQGEYAIVFRSDYADNETVPTIRLEKAAIKALKSDAVYIYTQEAGTMTATNSAFACGYDDGKGILIREDSANFTLEMTNCDVVGLSRGVAAGQRCLNINITMTDCNVSATYSCVQITTGSSNCTVSLTGGRFVGKQFALVQNGSSNNCHWTLTGIYAACLGDIAERTVYFGSNVTERHSFTATDCTFIGEGNNAIHINADGNDKPVLLDMDLINCHVEAPRCCISFAAAKGSTLNIYGGTYIDTVSDADRAIEIVGYTGNESGNESDYLLYGSIVNVYGGYFVGNRYGVFGVSFGSTLTIHGGTFYMNVPNGDNYADVSVIRVGMVDGFNNPTPGTLTVKGGNFISDSVTCPIFQTRNANGNIELISYNVIGGSGLCYNQNAAPTTASSGSWPQGVNAASVGGIEMVNGCSVRLVAGSTGLRFVTRVPIDIVNKIESNAAKDENGKPRITYGTLIMPTDMLVSRNVPFFQHKGLELAGLEAGKDYVDIVADNGLVEEREKGELVGLVIRAALVNIKETNIEREFSAVGYVKYVEVRDGYEVENYYYTVYLNQNNSRSIAVVAKRAMEDTKGSSDEQYDQEVSDGVFSPYTTAQRNMLSTWVKDLGTLDIYLIAGQSNAGGTTLYNQGFSDAYNSMYNVLYNGNSQSNGQSSSVAQNLRRVNTMTVGAGLGKGQMYMGPEIGMAAMLDPLYDDESGPDKTNVAIVKYAYGGTTLTNDNTANGGNWSSPSYVVYRQQNGGSVSNDQGALYRNFIKHVSEAVDYYYDMGYSTVNIKALFWMQGESDRGYEGIVTAGHVNYYPTAFQYLISDMRNDLKTLVNNTDEVATMPVLVGEISEAFGCANTANNTNFVNMQQALPTTLKDSNLYVINSNDLCTGCSSSDTAHWTAEDMLLIGKKVGKSLLENVLGQQNVADPAKTDTMVAEVFNSAGVSKGQYNNLGWALAIAPAGGTVKLLQSITLYGPISVGNPNAITLDGNGKTITHASTGHGFKIAKGSNLTVKNLTYENVTNEDNAYGFFLYGSTLTIENGSYKAYKYVVVANYTSTVTINGGSFETRASTHRSHAAVYLGSYDTSTTDGDGVIYTATNLTINGGSFIANGIGAALHLNYYAKNSTVTVKGGSFKSTEGDYAINCDIDGADLTVSGATVYTGKVAPIYYNAPGNVLAYTVTSANKLTTSTKTLLEQLNAAAAGATVYMTKDQSFTATLAVTNTKGVTLNGANYALTVNVAGHGLQIKDGANVTFKNLKYKNSNSDNSVSNNYGIYMYEGAKLTVESGSYEAYRHVLVINYTCTVTINGGSFLNRAGTEGNHSPLYVGSTGDSHKTSSTVTVNGGSFSSVGKGAALNIASQAVGCKVKVTGGSFTTKGEYTIRCVPTFTTGSLSIANATVSSGTKARLASTHAMEVYFVENGKLRTTTETLAQALNSAPAGSTLYLLRSLTVTATLTVTNPNAFTFDGAGYILTASHNSRGIVLGASGDDTKAAHLTMQNITYDHSVTTSWGAYGFMMHKGSTLIINSGTYKAVQDVIVVGEKDCTLKINGGTFSLVNTKYTSYNGAIVYVQSAATVIISGGTLTPTTNTGTHKDDSSVKVYGYSVYLNTSSSGAMVYITGGTLNAGGDGKAIRNDSGTKESLYVRSALDASLSSKIKGSYTKN